MRTEIGAASIPLPCASAFPAPTAAEILCDELIDHTFLCEICINGNEELCPTYAALKQRVADAGGITRGIALTM